MPRLILDGRDRSATITLGESVDLVIVGGVVSVAGCLLASYAGGSWHVGRQSFEKISYSDPVRIDVQPAAGRRLSFGPFLELSLAGPLVCSGAGVLARYDSMEETWYFDGTVRAATPSGSASRRRPGLSAATAGSRPLSSSPAPGRNASNLMCCNIGATTLP